MRDEVIFDRILERYCEEMCTELQNLIRIKTVTADPAPEPLSERAIGAALSNILNLGRGEKL